MKLFMRFVLLGILSVSHFAQLAFAAQHAEVADANQDLVAKVQAARMALNNASLQLADRDWFRARPS